MQRTIIALILGVFIMAGAPVMAAQAAGPEKAQKQSVEPVKHSDVCMVQNRHGIMKMIPVEVDGKTYYGCCGGCVGKLKYRADVRSATDPFTGRQVDKASAFIVGNPDGTVIYFESKETAERFFASRRSL